MRIAVIGAGAIGCLFSAILNRNGAEVILFSRRKQAVEKINRWGIEVVEHGGESYVSHVRCATDSRELSNTDLVIITVKSYDTEEVAKRIRPNIPRETRVLTVQNGVGNVETLSKVFNEQHVLGGVTTQASTLLSDNKILHAHHGETLIGGITYDNKEEALEIAEHLTRHGLPTRAVDNILVEIWVKALVNSVINPLTAIMNVRNGELLGMENFTKLARWIIGEGVMVCRRLGISLEEENVLARVLDIVSKTRENKSSMLQDILRGRRTEIDYLNGKIAELGEKLGVETPTNTLLYSLIKELEKKKHSKTF